MRNLIILITCLFFQLTSGISIDSNPVIWNNYLSQHGYKWDNYLQSGKNTLSNYLGIQAFPAYLLVNGKGEIIGNFDSWTAVIDSLNKNYN